MKILYGVQATGNGHISRAHCMAPELAAAGLEVDYLFSGRATDKYFDMQPFGSYQTLGGFTFVTAQGEVNWRQTLRQLDAAQLWRDISALDLSDYDLVLNDYEPISAHAARRQRVPSVGISHQNAFRYRIPKVRWRAANFAIMNQLAPTDTAIGLHWDNFGEPLLPPIIAPHQRAPQPTDNPIATVLVYLPFESLAELRHLFAKLDGQHFIIYHPDCSSSEQIGHCEFKPLSRVGFARDLQTAESVFCNAGFELPSEALAQGKRLLVKPVRGQIEQLSNAIAVEQLELGWCTKRLEAQLVRDWLDSEPASPRDYPNVAQALAQWLADGRRESIRSLSERLWTRADVRAPTTDHRLTSLALAAAD
jgi:uncharacterized protein (TIGR00661 family)